MTASWHNSLILLSRRGASGNFHPTSPPGLGGQPGGLPDRYDGCDGGLEGRRRVLIRPAASDSRRDDPDHAATALMLAVGIPFGSQVAPARANIRFTL